jgi:hypothetical protein
VTSGAKWLSTRRMRSHSGNASAKVGPPTPTPTQKNTQMDKSLTGQDSGALQGAVVCGYFRKSAFEDEFSGALLFALTKKLLSFSRPLEK